MKNQIHRDVGLGIFLLAFCVLVFFWAIQIPGEACYLPVALTIMMAVCAIFITAKGLRLSKLGEFKYSLTVKDSKYAFQFMAFIAVYYLLFRYVTYWLATPLFMIFAMKHLKLKSWKVNLIITIVYMIVCYVVFVIILQLPIYKVGVLGRYFRYV